MGVITVSPTMMQAIMMAIQLALMQFLKEAQGMTETELVIYIAGQEDRQKALLQHGFP